MYLFPGINYDRKYNNPFWALSLPLVTSKRSKRPKISKRKKGPSPGGRGSAKQCQIM